MHLILRLLSLQEGGGGVENTTTHPLRGSIDLCKKIWRQTNLDMFVDVIQTSTCLDIKTFRFFPFSGWKSAGNSAGGPAVGGREFAGPHGERLFRLAILTSTSERT